ncbi:MAG: hypothetical protein AAGA64_12565 [Bacteroidota bacterium]
MATLKGQYNLPLLRELLDQIQEKANKPESWFRFSFNEMETLAEKINKAFPHQPNIGAGTLKGYGYMYQDLENHPIAISWNKLELLCEYAGLPIDNFNQNQKNENEVLILITEDFFEPYTPHIAKRLKRRYATMKEELGIRNLQVEIAGINQTPYSKSEARNLAIANQADLILWGESIGENKIKLKFQLVDLDRFKIDHKYVSDHYLYHDSFISDLSPLCEGDALIESEYLLFYALAAIAYNKGQDGKALAYWQKVSALYPEIADPHFYQGVIHQQDNNLIEAIKCYKMASNYPYLGTDIPFKIAINHAILLLQSPSKDHLSEAQVLLSNPSFVKTKYEKQQRVLLDHIENLSENQNTSHTLDQKDSALKVIKVDKQIFKNDERIPIITLELLHHNDLLWCREGQKKLTLIDQQTLLPYALDVSEQPQKVKELLTPLEAFKTHRTDIFEIYKHKYPWLILNPTRIHLVNEDDWDATHTIHYTLKDQEFKKNLRVESEHLILNKDILADIPDREQTTHLEKVRIVSYDRNSDTKKSQPIPGLVFMEDSYFKAILPTLHHFYRHHGEAQQLNIITSIMYQTFGAIPTAHLKDS